MEADGATPYLMHHSTQTAFGRSCEKNDPEQLLKSGESEITELLSALNWLQLNAVQITEYLKLISEINLNLFEHQSMRCLLQSIQLSRLKMSGGRFDESHSGECFNDSQFIERHLVEDSIYRKLFHRGITWSRSKSDLSSHLIKESLNRGVI